MNRHPHLVSAPPSRVMRWIHAGLSVSVSVELLGGIIMQSPQGDHPANVFDMIHRADNLATLAFAAGFWAIPGAGPNSTGRRPLLGLITATAVSGLLSKFGGEPRMALWHGLLCDLTGVFLLRHVLAVLLRHLGFDSAISDMWSLGRNAAGQGHNRD